MLAPGLVLYVGRGGSADAHAHHAVQLVLAEAGTVTITVGGREVEVRAGLVPARISHSFVAPPAARVALVLVDAHGGRGAELDRRAHVLAGQDLSPSLSDVPLPTGGFSAEEGAAWCGDVLRALGVDTTHADAPSRTTRRAIAYIEGALDGVPRIGAAAAYASTSASRLSHRFTAEVGLPFRRFVLWTRVKRAVEVVRRGGDLTEAALEAGFSDAAHLSRTFRAMFGLSPSLVLPHVELTGSPWRKSSPLAE